MHVSIVSSHFFNNDSEYTQFINFTGIAAETGDLLVLFGHWYPKTLGHGVGFWGSNEFATYGSEIDTGEAKINILTCTISSGGGGTNDISIPFDDYVFCNAALLVLRDAEGEPITLEGFVSELYNVDSGAYVAPSLTVTAPEEGSLIVDFLAAMGWNKDYDDVSATTWTPTADLEGEIQNTGTKAVNRLQVATEVATGIDVLTEWTPSAAQPMYSHFAMYFKGAPFTGGYIQNTDSPLQVGTRTDIVTVGMATLTDITMNGENVLAVNAPDGIGNFTVRPFVNGESYPPMGGDVELIAYDVNGKASDPYAVGIETMGTYQYVDVVDLDRGPWSLGKAFEGEPDPEQLHAPFDGVGSLLPNGTLENWALGTYRAWARMPDGIMRSFRFKVTTGGVSIAGFVKEVEFVGFIQ